MSAPDRQASGLSVALFDGDTGALDDRVDLVFGDFLAVIVQDEGRVSASKFSRLYDVL